jgi:pyruvate/2-oxoglutarate dehydrogenase complex dihydrolipoamide dehydrogenase (E3) component
MHAFDLVVAGGGPAGVTAALRARELGATVALVERGKMGGTCTNDGCAPTRVLAKAARLVRDAGQYADYGLDPATPAVDLPALLARTQQTVYRLHEKKQLLQHLEQAGVTVWAEAGAGHFTGPHTFRLAGGTELHGNHFIIAAGGRARRLSFPGSELALTHSDVWSLRRLPRRVAIVGAAATGCQLASIFASFGSQVTLVDFAPTILGGEDAQTSAFMTGAFRRRGIAVETGASVERIEQREDGLRLHFRQAGSARSVDAGVIILAVGWVGNVGDLNLEAAGVELDPSGNYIRVDDSLRSSAPHIFAAGDITGRIMLVQSATHEARVAAENALLGSEQDCHGHIVPHGGFTDPEYGSVGMTEAQAQENEAVAVAVVPYADLDRAVIDGRTEGFCKLLVSRSSHQILGAHVVGEQALEVVQVAAAGMAAAMDVRQLAALELAYPTFTSVAGLAARQLVRELELTPLAPQWSTLRPLAARAAEWERAAGQAGS